MGEPSASCLPISEQPTNYQPLAAPSTTCLSNGDPSTTYPSIGDPFTAYQPRSVQSTSHQHVENYDLYPFPAQPVLDIDLNDLLDPSLLLTEGGIYAVNVPCHNWLNE